MARIRIVDEWLRSPVSPPSRHRAIMVVADSWAEQRVLMRAFAGSADQTRPTILLHGMELAVGPAGVAPHGEWGIHVQPPVDGRAQELKGQLELAAQRLAGSKGTPPRLEDESSDFEKKATNNWAPGTPRDRASIRQTVHSPTQAAAMAPVAPATPGYYEPAVVAPPTPSTAIPSAAPAPMAPPGSVARAAMPTMAVRSAASPTPPAGFPAARQTPQRGWTSPVPNRPAKEVGSTTATGFAPGAGSARVARGKSSTARARSKLSNLVSNTMPLGFQLSVAERDVLNALGGQPSLTARKVGQLVGVADPVSWMEQLMSKLADHGLDLIAPGEDMSGEPTYVLRR